MVVPAPRGSARLPERLAFVAGLVVLAGLALVARRPVDAVFPPRLVPLDVTGAQSDGGSAWRVRVDIDVGPSDKDGGRSVLEVLEDGAPLVPHAVHQDLRDGALGRFSHWGDTLYFTPTDGGDPRAGGRSFVLRLPSEVPGWTLHALVGAGIAGAALLLMALIGAWRRRGLRSPGPAAWVAITVLLGCAVLVGRHSWWTSTAVLADGARALVGPSPHAERVRDESPAEDVRADSHADSHAARDAAVRPGNVTRLLPGGAVDFAARGALPPGDDSRRVPLVPQDGVARDGDFVRLDPGGPGLRAVLDPPWPVADVAEIVLPARVRAGGSLELRLVDAATPTRTVQVALAVEARADVQALRVLQPVQLFDGWEAASIASIEWVSPALAARGAQLAASEVVLVGHSERFLGATHGEHVLARHGEQRPAAWQSVPGRFTLPLVGEGSLVKGAVALFGRAPDAPVRARVSYVDARGASHPLGEETWDDLSAWREWRFALPRGGGAQGADGLRDADAPRAGDAPRVTDAPREGDADAPRDVLVLDVDVLPAGTAVAWSGVRLVDASRAPRRVLVVLLDTLRADALSSFGGRHARTPVLDALAADGVRFARCLAQAHWTRPSMPSIMTARYVAATGVDTVGQQLPEAYTTLAEAFAENGFLTVADVANTNAGPAAGLDQGFDRVGLYVAPRFGSAREQLLDARLLYGLGTAVEEDLLLSIHLMDAHGPYGPPAAPEVDDAPTGTPIARHEDFDRLWTKDVSAAGRHHWYHRDVEAMDATLGEFLAALRELWGDDGRRDFTYAILSDHGEYLGEHGQWGHGWFALLPEVVHVPLILGGPGLPAGRVVSAPVENLDVAPTLLELAGLSAAPFASADGRSLLPLVRDGDGRAQRVAMAGVRLGQSEQFALYGESQALLGEGRQLVEQLAFRPASHGAWTGFVRLGGAARGAESVLVHTLREALGRRFGTLWTTYAETGEASRAPLWEGARDASSTVDAEELRQLQALGYVEK